MTGPKPSQTTVAHRVEYGIKSGIVSVLVVGIRRRDPGAIVNAGLGLAAASLPDVLEHRYDLEFRPWQRVYATIAMLTHAFGMLGPYDDVWWWDHLTHTHSATLLSGIVYAVSRRRGRDPRPDVIGVVACVGVLWELMEYIIHRTADRLGIEPILITYSKFDIVFDLVFDLLGAALVLVFGEQLLENFIDDTTRSP
ncbi:hypothetical protein [Halalkalicoccus jeotgali]|uniref:Uncharacterized protein n=1 Tax=Halalkalicoccus jeotgali (strain DSM 18796 / CECT 7217 / JCM 14584 / KCTC 4019 / B3) TaxID=795797 RepID=D8J6N9_HALJB|nr:hypothetical protein [Halalkalicoccus jeotgali]ADJ13916.1 hypothetical protein HacjB3_02615 [Halalkalicoccus jeotgali B3]ELY34039.1 hypothetical protein C497_16707 [Halalkalicoccus jeotgali B3]